MNWCYHCLHLSLPGKSNVLLWLVVKKYEHILLRKFQDVYKDKIN